VYFGCESHGSRLHIETEAGNPKSKELVNAIKIILKNLEVNKEMKLISENIFQCQLFHGTDLLQFIEIDG
jgi:hypothetical protein